MNIQLHRIISLFVVLASLYASSALMAMAISPMDSSQTSPNDWNSLSPDLQERILLRLPISTAVKLASVCKQWHLIISSLSFTTQLSRLTSGKQPWFFLWGINELIHTRSVRFAFDPSAGCWLRLQISRPPDFNRASLSGTDRLLFASSGSRVCYSTTATKMKWKETSSASSTRCSALMGIFGSLESDSFKFVVVGGVLDGHERMVELYDSSTNSWEECDPLPEAGFSYDSSSHWMSSAVRGQRFYVAEIHSGGVAAFDVEKKSWSEVRTLNAPDVVYLFILGCEEGLFIAGVCNNLTEESLKLFRVDELTMHCEEVSKMPVEFFSLFKNEGQDEDEDEGEDKAASLRCVGAGNLVYVYSESYYKGYPVCVCDLSHGCYQWKQLPRLPSPLPRTDRVVCWSTTVTPRACLRSL